MGQFFKETLEEESEKEKRSFFMEEEGRFESGFLVKEIFLEKKKLGSLLNAKYVRRE